MPFSSHAHCSPCFCRDRFNPREYLRAAYQRWLRATCHHLGLTEYFFNDPITIIPIQQQEQNERNANAENNNNNQQQQPPLQPEDPELVLVRNTVYQRRDIIIPHKPAHGSFPLRIMTLLSLAWATLQIVLATVFVVPLTTGRFLFSKISGVPAHDLYAFITGVYLIGGCVYGMTKLVKAAQRLNANANANNNHHMAGVLSLMKRCGVALWIGIEVLILSFVGLIVIPLLIGVAFDLIYLIPSRVPTDQTPVFFFVQDWTMGLIAGKILYRLTGLFPILSPLRDRFRRFRRGGLANLQTKAMLMQVFLPICWSSLCFLFLPYWIAFTVLPKLGVPLLMQSGVWRYFYPTFAGLVFAYHLALISLQTWNQLHQAVRDDRYRVLRRLRNYDNDIVDAAALPIAAPGVLNEID